MDLTVNGRTVSVTAGETTPLLDVLRNHLGLKGTRYGCGLEQCGTCMVLIEGKPDYSCAREVGSVAGHAVTTIEGLGTAENLHPLQRAFLEEQAGQCGYCLSGILISAKALLDSNPAPTRAEIVAALDNNLCRCGAHPRIIRAIQKAAAALHQGAAA
jgi:nicotinate dehydrogenase subunit A